MSASFRKIDYSLRPAKHAERRMIAEIFRHLRPFEPVENYIYVGFGSLWFSDFILLHRLLGIREMVSIEREVQAKPRIDANRPFASVRIDYRQSDLVLPSLDWAKRHFVWLDYDDPLLPAMLADARSVAARAPSGSVLAISTQCQKAPEIGEAGGADEGVSALAVFVDRFGRDKVPISTEEATLYGWQYGRLSLQMLRNEIEEALSIRNQGLAVDGRLSFQPICDFEYSDDVKMTTLTGVFVSLKDVAKHNACHLEALDFLPSEGRLVKIAVPKLTVREVREIEQSLPWPPGGQPVIGAIPESDARKFADYYRYLPNFAVLET